MSKSVQLKKRFPVPQEELFACWTDPTKHAAITGAPAKGMPIVGGTFTAWDGYITAVYLELHKPDKLVQHWRTHDFKTSDPDSLLVVEFLSHKMGCDLILTHSNIPDDSPDYEKGWKDFYFKPMQNYFAGKKS